MTKDNAIQSVAAGKDARRYRPVFRGGVRVKGVYERDGVIVAYVRDPQSGARRWVRAPGQTVADAEAIVKRSSRLRDEADRAAFRDALQGARRRSEYASIGRLLELWPKAADARRALVGAPRVETVRTRLTAMRQVYAGHLEESAERAPEIVRAYLEGRAGQIAAISRQTLLRRARVLLAPWARSYYERNGARVPAALAWPETEPVRYRYRAPPEPLRRRTVEAGKEQVEARSMIGAAFLCCYFGGMACADAARARWDWLGADGHLHFERHKTGNPCDPPLPRWALEHWRAWAAAARRERPDDPHVLGGFRGDGARSYWLHHAVAGWMHAIGWPPGDGAHELRKLAASLWMSTCGLAYAARWIGDSQDTCARYYADCLPEHAPTVPEP